MDNRDGRSPRWHSWIVPLTVGLAILGTALGIATIFIVIKVTNAVRVEMLARPGADPAFLAALDTERNVMLLILGAIVLVATLGIVTGLILLLKGKKSPEATTATTEHILKTLSHPDGLRRVLIVRRADGLYGYEIEEFWREEVEFRREPIEYWLPLRQVPIAIFDSAETAEREARNDIAWLKELPPES